MVVDNNIGRQLMNNVNHALALRIQELLEEKKITRYKLAMESGIPHSTLKNIIHETVMDNLLSTTILIASGFGMTVSEFLDSPLFDEENLNI
ncbi:MAG: helix-turn-helix domain-containing protein [Clostridia bacterium]|nr:helix-turn-helix domain-containing protein [Clostridia bacterium]